MLFVYNSHYEAVNFTLPAVAEAVRWERLIDTNSRSKGAGLRVRVRICRNWTINARFWTCDCDRISKAWSAAARPQG